MKIKRVLIWSIVIIGAFGLGFIAFNFFIMPAIGGSGKSAAVPNVIGKPLVEAQKIILAQKFALGEVNDVFDSIFPQGHIAGQKPLAGSIAKTGRKVNLLVSKGPQMVKIPFIEQISLDQGLRILSSLGINAASIESLRSTTIPSGKIIGLEPGPGSELPTGGRLKVFVSSGLFGIFLMPTLVGLPFNTAADSIRSNGLILGGIETIPSEEPQGLVIIQYPEDGMRVRNGDTVKLIISERRR
jgi:serine/threonine-protein kinase